MASNNKIEKRQEQSEMMKKFKQNPLVFIGTVLVLILVIITFVFWGAGDWILPNRSVLSDDQLTFGYYDKKPIELKPGSFFAEQREINIQQQRQIRDERYATEQAFNAAVVRTAILDAMAKVHYVPPKKVIDKQVAELPRYQEDGKFSLLRYRQDDEATHLEIQKQVRDNFIANRYWADTAGQMIDDGRSQPNIITGPKYSYAVLVSSKEADFIGKMAKVQRKFNIAVFPFSLFPDEQVIAFVEKNPQLFKKTHLSQITINASKNDSEAKKILESIQNGTTTFEDAAKNHSEDSFKQAGGDAGSRMAYELTALIPDETERNTVVNLPAGQISALTKVPSGWAIFRAESAAENPDLADKTVVERIRNYMTGSERGVIEDWIIEKAGGFVKDVENGDWKTAIIAHNIEDKEFGPLPVNYGDSLLFSTVGSFNEPAVLKSAGQSENFWKIAFSTPAGKPSNPFVVSANQENVVVLFPTEENADDTEAVKNTTDSYKYSNFVENDTWQSVTDVILNSPKLENNFQAKYMNLFFSR